MGKLAAISPEKSNDNAEIAALLPLDGARNVAFKTKRGRFVYHFRRIQEADWKNYFLGIVNQTLQTGGERETVFETESALLELVENTLIGADGYGDALDNVEALKGPGNAKEWKSYLPLRHRVAAGIALRSVGASKPAAEAPILCDLVEVSLDAQWGDESGKMVFYTGLIHRFRHPSIADLKRFNYESARTRVRGTADAGVTTYPSRQAIAMKIYDDLIESVEGYSVEPLSGAEQIKREMDGAHKAAAALALFDADDEITVE